MRKFYFSLQHVLDVRNAEREAVEQRLAQCLCELEKSRQLRRQIVEQIARQVDSIEQLGRSGPVQQQYMLHLRYMEGLQHKLLLQTHVVAGIEKRVEKIRQEHYKALRACKGLEKLQEREQDEWSAAHRREEQRLLDEVAVTGHYRDRLMEEGMASL